MESGGDQGGENASGGVLGRVLDGRYRIDGLLGEGGLGQVYRATDQRLSRSVAIKIMHSHHVARQELRARFDREARSLAALSHPNIVGIVDYGVDGEVPFLVMELLEGRTLEAAMLEGLPVERVVPILREVLRAVAYAHAQGLVHRDLKPANVFLQRVPELGEVVRVLDFGLAKFVDVEESAPTLTRAGMVLGTPAYMSPEQATGDAIDARADVYALGIVLFEMATGTRPFRATDGPELLKQHLLSPLPSMRESRPDAFFRPELEAIAQRASAKSRADRFRDAAEMAAALDALPDAPIVAPTLPVAAGTGPKSPRPSIPETDETLSAAKTERPPPPSATDATVASSPESELPVAPPAKSLAIDVHVASVVHASLADAKNGTGAGPLAQQVAPARPRSFLPWVGVLATLAAVLGVAWVSRFMEPPRPPMPAPAQDALASDAAVAPPDAGPSRPGPERAPFAEGTPPQLEPIEARVRAERELTEEQRGVLNRYSANHPRDARAWLLLAHADVTIGARTDACRRYQRAYRADENARYDETMRRDLLLMAAHRAVTETASDLVVEVYGAAALDHIAEAEREVPRDEEALARLEALRARLSRPAE